jgi:hypothetical protein
LFAFRKMLAQWLLCLWQAQRVQAPWWALVAIMGPMMGVEALLPGRRARPNRAWPELLRAGVTLMVIMHACLVLYANLWKGGRALGPILLTVATWGLTPFQNHAPRGRWLEPLAFAVGVGVGVWSLSAGGGQQQPFRGWLEWVHLVLRLHMLMLANNKDVLFFMEEGWWIRPVVGLVGLCIVCAVHGGEGGTTIVDDSPWLLLALPCMCMHARRLIWQFIAPIVELGGGDAARQKEVLLYIMAWSVVLGWGCRPLPTLLLVGLAAAALASFRRGGPAAEPEPQLINKVLPKKTFLLQQFAAARPICPPASSRRAWP